MKSADELKARLGGNMRESMGANRPAATPSTGPALHGEAAKYQGASRVKDALAIEVDRIMPDPDQPRKEFDADHIAELASSLKSRGQLQPIRVRWGETSGCWVIVSGERRYRAAIMAGLPALLCIESRGSFSPDDILEDQLVENCLREDLKPIEQARAFRTLLDRRGWSHRQLAESLHIAPGSVARALALLDLPAAVQSAVEGGELAASTAYAIATLDDPAVQAAVAGRAVAEGLSRDEVVRTVRARSSSSKGKGRAGGGKAKKVTERSFRVAGCRVVVENKRGLDQATIRTAMMEVVAAIDTEAVESAA